MKMNLYTSKKTMFVILSAFLLGSAGCQEVIEIDLNKVPPAIVIEGNVTDQPGPYKVQLTTTVNFDQPNQFPAVQGATVTLSDNLGNSDLLVESAPGIYSSTTLTGVPGRNYFLKVISGGKEYTATSSMAAAVPIDTILVDSLTFGAVSNKYLNVRFTDPVGAKNFYRIIEIINGDTLNMINLSNDEFEDGDQITVPIFSDEDPKLESGDNVEILLQCIDENVYNYFVQLIDVINNGGQSAAPANPITNLSNDALGYFNAYSVRSKTILVP